jgi:hypothetical protein
MWVIFQVLLLGIRVKLEVLGHGWRICVVDHVERCDERSVAGEGVCFELQLSPSLKRCRSSARVVARVGDNLNIVDSDVDLLLDTAANTRRMVLSEMQSTRY